MSGQRMGKRYRTKYPVSSNALQQVVPDCAPPHWIPFAYSIALLELLYKITVFKERNHDSYRLPVLPYAARRR